MIESSSVVNPCHYVVLDVACDASVAEISAAYHKLVEDWQLEGDSSAMAESRESYLRMKEAYVVMSNASTRTMYDTRFSPVLPDYQLWNSLFLSVIHFLAEMEVLGMLEDINKLGNPPQALKRRERPCPRIRTTLTPSLAQQAFAEATASSYREAPWEEGCGLLGL
ncbi:unnamed protein product [Urochloa humidicola]